MDKQEEVIKHPLACSLLVLVPVYYFSGKFLKYTLIPFQEQDEAAQKKQREKQDALQNLKTTIFVSAIIVAVAGAVFAITKKLREK